LGVDATGMPVEIMTPGKNQKHYLADGWDVRTGIVHHCFAARENNQLSGTCSTPFTSAIRYNRLRY
jgi:hypothetical protein